MPPIENPDQAERHAFLASMLLPVHSHQRSDLFCQTTREARECVCVLAVTSSSIPCSPVAGDHPSCHPVISSPSHSILLFLVCNLFILCSVPTLVLLVAVVAPELLLLWSEWLWPNAGVPACNCSFFPLPSFLSFTPSAIQSFLLSMLLQPPVDRPYDSPAIVCYTHTLLLSCCL